MTPEEVVAVLKSRNVASQPFAVARALCAFVAGDYERSLVHELVIRALDQRESFGSAAVVIDGLVREIGLFPYLEREQLGFADRIAYEYHRPENLGKTVFHREQAAVFRALMQGENVVLSAPTSFGKSLLIDAVIANRDFRNICVIVPSVALVDETRRRLQRFSPRYKVITQVGQQPSERNIYVLTQERAVERTDIDHVDFFVIDEFYKLEIDPQNPERGVTLNRAFYRLLQNRAQFYMLGPNIRSIPREFVEQYKVRFFETEYTTVVSEILRVDHDGSEAGRETALISLLSELEEQTLVYCRSPVRLSQVLTRFIELTPAANEISEDAVRWFGTYFHPEWQFVQALRRGVGIHHGRLPRSLSQYAVRLFNAKKVRILVCTSSLIEGVNTKAKNMVIYDGTINRRKLDSFTFRNISGRAGRMRTHLVGNIYLFDDPPQEEDRSVDFPFFTQAETTPTELLLTLQPEDLKVTSRARVAAWTANRWLSIATLAKNTSVPPQLQLSLAEHLVENAEEIAPLLNWAHNPKYRELRQASQLIWEFLSVRPERVGGARSYRQLTWRVMKLRRFRGSIAGVVRDELLNNRFGRTPDQVVSVYLDVMKNWVQYRYPRALMVLDSIQREVFTKLGLPSGDFSGFAAQLEHLFTDASLVALDEYGLPLPIALKLRRYLIRPGESDFDAVIGRLRRLEVSQLDLTKFEQGFVKYARKNAPDTLFNIGTDLD